MSRPFFLFITFSCLLVQRGLADQCPNPYTFVPRDEPILIVTPSPLVQPTPPQDILRGRLLDFFRRYGIAEEMGSAIGGRITGQLVETYGASIIHISEESFLFFILDQLGVPSTQQADIVERVRVLVASGHEARAALLQAVYESQDINDVAERIERVELLIHARYGFLEAYWVDYFRSNGFTEVQAKRASARMGVIIKSGASVRHAYWDGFLSLLFSSESYVRYLAMRAVDLETQGVAYDDVLVRVLFRNPFGADAMLVQAFSFIRGQGVHEVTAFFYAYYYQIMPASDTALRGAEDYVEALDQFGFQRGMYERIIYEQYGFPPRVAQAAFDCLDNLRRTYPHMSPNQVFWLAAFRVLGVSENNSTTAYSRMIQLEREGLSLQRSFEQAYIQIMGTGLVDFRALFIEFDSVLSSQEGEASRIATLLELFWKKLYPNTSVEMRTRALEGFLQSPSSLLGVLSALNRTDVEGLLIEEGLLPGLKSVTFSYEFPNHNDLDL